MRHHAASAPQFRGGGKAHGPRVRDIRLTCKEEGTGARLKHASARAKASDLIIIDDLRLEKPRPDIAEPSEKPVFPCLVVGTEVDRNSACRRQ